jgi:serine/threonine-protein kinase
MAEPTAIEPGSILAGKLRVVRLIGEGGMGAVYEVEHELTKHRRALKMLHHEMTQIPGVVARFLREASAAGRIGSPHIVETFDAGQLESGEPYIVMEMLSGKPLDNFIESKGRLDAAEAIEILKQACDGIQAAHDAGIIHRDLKPENLFLAKGDKLFVKILDFGISKFDSQRTGDHKLTVEGTALGTPFYMPPEQVRGEADIDVRADVYALGVVLYECLTGQKPFVAETLPHLAVLIHEGNYEPLSKLRPDAPPGLEQVVSRAMAKDRAARYPSVRALRESLEEIDTGGQAKGRSSTLIAPASMTGGVAAHSASQHASGALAGGETGTGLALSTATQAQKRFPKGLVAAAAVAVVGVVGAFVVSSAKQSGPAVAHEPSPAATAPTLAPAPAPKPTAVPEVAPVAAAPTATAPTPATATASATAPLLPTASATVAPRPVAHKKPSTSTSTSTPPAPAPAAKKPGNTRASQHGLAEDNPF